MFGDLSLGEVVYGAAERAILSSELAAGARDLRPDAASSDQSLLDEVNEQIRAIKDELAAVEAAFKRSSKTAEQLSERVAEPERQRAAEHDRLAAATAARERRERARTHLEEVSQRAKETPASEPDNVIDRIESVAAGYSEAITASDQVLNRPSETANRESDSDASPASTRHSVMKAAKFTASAAKWSATAAESTAEKFRK